MCAAARGFASTGTRSTSVGTRCACTCSSWSFTTTTTTRRLWTEPNPTSQRSPCTLHAIAGVPTSETMQVSALIGGATLRALLDSGSTHNFISEEATARTNLRYQLRTGMRVTVANGERVPWLGIFRNATFVINTENFAGDFFVLPLAGYDVVLDTHWLASLGPILWDFGRLTMSFWYGDHQVQWRGVAGPASPRLNSCIGRDLLEQLLAAFSAVFAEPRGLPPRRARDHRIHLMPGAAPVAVRPYRYPAAHKDELERQCRSMEEQGLIRRSSSAFSSPVLLVRKADNSWRFCVDYRALNALTVKDTFPIPVVDELLNELHGAKYFTKLDLRSGYHQVRMHPEDVAKTAFRTHDGLYEFLVMPFGLCSAPATFQALMNEVLRPFLRRFVLVFFDDILIVHHGRSTSGTFVLSSPCCRIISSLSRDRSVHSVQRRWHIWATSSRPAGWQWTAPRCGQYLTGRARVLCARSADSWDSRDTTANSSRSMAPLQRL